MSEGTVKNKNSESTKQPSMGVYFSSGKEGRSRFHLTITILLAETQREN